VAAVEEKLDFEALRERAKSSMYFFAKGILGYGWIVPHIHGSLCAALEDPQNTRLMFVLPRGWLKTTLCTISYSMWRSIKRPDIRILLTQNSSTNACKKLAVIREQWEKNVLLRALFPELLPSRSNTWKADSVCLTRAASFAESTYEAAGTSTRVVSRHYDVVIEDDTVAPDLDELGNEELAPTHDDVQKAIGWHRTNVLPLLNNPLTDTVIIVGTRWYDQDLIRYVMDNEPQYKVITRACRELDGKPDAAGELTYPERFNDAVLQELEVNLGPYMFNCLYMNRPVRSEDMAFKPHWFQYYENLPASTALAIYTTIDTATDPAMAKTPTTDYSVVMTCGKDLGTGQIYVLEYFRARCNPGELCDAVLSHVLKFKPVCVAFQNVTFERSVVYWLRELMRRTGHFFALQPLDFPNRKDGKETRIAGLQPLFSNGVISVKPHMKELISELLKFPLGKNDDIADALSMQLVLWKSTRSNKEIFYGDSTNKMFSLETAMAEISARRNPQARSVVFEPSRTSSGLDLFHFSAGRHN
jgi:predicted phage terminase large subunit-like protein